MHRGHPPKRGLQQVYAAIFVDAIHVKVRDGRVGNRPFYFYIAIGVDWIASRVPSRVASPDTHQSQGSGRGVHDPVRSTPYPES